MHKKTFLQKFSFVSFLFKQMRKLKRWIIDDKNHEDSNCFSLTVISHGNKQGHLLDKNKNRGWDTEEFVADLSEVETLTGKPKVIVLQSCRGSRHIQHDLTETCSTFKIFQLPYILNFESITICVCQISGQRAEKLQPECWMMTKTCLHRILWLIKQISFWPMPLFRDTSE